MSPSDSAGYIQYEVSVEVEVTLVQSYRLWLDTYVREMVSFPGFVSARLYDVLAPAPPAGMQGFCVQFVLRDTASLDIYLREHAMKFRASSLALFGDHARANRSRRVMRHTITFDHDAEASDSDGG